MSPTSTRQAKNQAKSRFCSICYAEARIINYGVLSCYSCKTFFRRHCSRTEVNDRSNLFKKKKRNYLFFQTLRECQFGNQCVVTIETRKFCAPCRLNKCLAMGMSSELIRKDYERKKSETNKKTKVMFSDTNCTVFTKYRKDLLSINHLLR